MKKFLGLIASVAVAVGIFMFLIGMSTLGWDFKKLDTTVWESKVYESTQTVESIDFNFSSANVTIKKGETVKIQYEESERNKFEIEEENGELSVTEHWTWKLFTMFNFKTPQVTVTLPDNVPSVEINNTNGDIILDSFNGTTLNLQTTNGKISLTNCTYTAEATLMTTNDKIYLKNFSAGALTVKTTNGDIEADSVTVGGKASAESYNNEVALKNVSANALWTDSQNGKVLVSNSKITGLAEGNSYNSSVTFTSVEAGSIALDSKNGKINLIDCSAKGEIKATNYNSNIIADKLTAETVTFYNKNGDVKAQGIKSPAISAETYNGQIVLGINGVQDDYKIVDTWSRNGRVNAPNSGSGNKTVSAQTHNGNVTITIG